MSDHVEQATAAPGELRAAVVPHCTVFGHNIHELADGTWACATCDKKWTAEP